MKDVLAEETPAQRPSRVLVATDNRVIDGILSRHLSRELGVEVEVAGPDEALGALEAEDYGLVALMDRFDLCRKLKGEDGRADTPVLMVVLDEDGRKEAVDHGADGVWVARNDGSGLTDALSLTAAAIEPNEVGERKRILIVEDSAVFRQSFVEALEGTPYRIRLAENGRQAVDVLDHFSPDLIVTDIEMPEMNGLEFTTYVRHNPDTAQLPVIIVSSRVDDATIEAGFDAGANEYLTKPFHGDELINKIELYINPDSSRRQETVLVVDDSKTLVNMVGATLRQGGYNVHLTTDPTRALDMVIEHRPDVVVSDVDMQGLTGFQLCRQVRATPGASDARFIILTDRESTGARMLGKKVGVSAYLTKPFSPDNLLMLIDRLLADRRLLKDLEVEMMLATITSLAKAIDQRDPYTRFHSENVSRYASAIAESAGMTSRDIEDIRLAGLLHDIGKIGVRDDILLKPGALTAEERTKIEEHSERGAKILQPVPSLGDIIPMILHHHERLDGSGYPYGLEGDNIPVGAQIMAVADTYDALVTDRPYRPGMSPVKAIGILKQETGTHLSAWYVEMFLEIVRRPEFARLPGQAEYIALPDENGL